MPLTIVSDDVLAKLLAVGPVKLGGDEARKMMEDGSGCFEPTPEVLRKAIDAVFWASLSAEERVPALTRVEFADIRNPQCGLEPSPMCAAALRKLSPLMDVPSNVLYAGKDANIIGVGSSVGSVGVVAHRPGHLAVRDDSVVLGVFDEGNWVIVGGSDTSLIQILQRWLPPESFRDRFLKATLIGRLAMAARRTGRGATFVILPADRQNGIGSISYPVEAFPALPQALEAWREAARATPSVERREHDRRLVGIASAVAAAGAGIDGATLIDNSSLRLLGFGAKISAADDDEEVRHPLAVGSRLAAPRFRRGTSVPHAGPEALPLAKRCGQLRRRGGAAMTKTSEPAIEYRIARRDDETGILDLLEEVASEIPTDIDPSDPLDPITGIIRQCCDSGKSWIAIDEDDSVVGFVLARKDIHDQQAIALPYIGVSPASRRRGIFSTLLDKAKANDVPLTATVLHSNKSAMADRLKNGGFTETERNDKQTKLRWDKPKPKSG
jgi:hypothetical protein